MDTEGQAKSHSASESDWLLQLQELSMSLAATCAQASAVLQESALEPNSISPLVQSLLAHLHQAAREGELKGLDYLISLLSKRPLEQATAQELSNWGVWSELLNLYAAGDLSAEDVGQLLTVAPVDQELPESFSALITQRLEADVVTIRQLVNKSFEPQEPSGLSVAADELEMLAEAAQSLAHDVCPELLRLQLPVQPSERDAWMTVLEAMGDRFGQFSNAAEFLELAPLCELMKNLADNFELLLASPELLQEDLRAALIGLPEGWAEFFKQPDEQNIALAMSSYSMPGWPLPPTAGALVEWEAALGQISLIRSRQVQIRDDDVSLEDLSLQIPAEADRSVVDNLLAELPLLSGEFSANIASLIGGNLGALEPAQRIAHTLKGSANTVGIRGIANLTHQLEDILQLLGAQQQLPRGALSRTLEDSADCLAEMAEAVAGLGSAPDNALEVYQSTIQWTNLLVNGEMPDADLPVPAKVQAASAPDAAPNSEQVAGASEAEAMLRVPLSLVDKLLDLAGESAMLLARVQNETGRMSNVHVAMRDGSDRLIELANELERLVDMRAGTVPGSRKATPMETLNAMRMPGQAHDEHNAEVTFDALELEEYNELHTVARRFAEAGADQKLLEQQVHGSIAEVANTIASLEAVQMQLRDVTLQTRMVAVSTVAPRMARAVRQTARMVGKQVDLEVSGETTLVDNELLQNFLEPLMHLLRNAVDHGIEPVEERRDAGKPEAGQIRLGFSRVGSNLLIVCEDDGAGMQLGKIRERAIEKGLLQADQECSERELCRLVLQPGFSTRDVASQVSGRGIGLDVVAQAVRQMRGSMEISSRPGQGSRFELHLPLRLSSVPVIVARSESHTVGLALRGIEQIVSVQDRSADGHHFLFQESNLPCLRLESLLGLPAEYFRRVGATEIALIVRDDLAQLHAIITPDLSQTQNVVLKPLSPWLGDIEGVEGAAVLGDGSVAPVCDLPELLSLLRRGEARGGMHHSQHAAAMQLPAENLPVCLIVDDSVSVRRTMELFVRDLGFQPESASDGLDALGKLQNLVPAMMLVDLEMPRMNGVELTATVRQDERLRHVPIIMITSRYTDKHKAMAVGAGVNSFMTKPYTEDELASQIHKLILH